MEDGVTGCHTDLHGIVGGECHTLHIYKTIALSKVLYQSVYHRDFTSQKEKEKIIYNSSSVFPAHETIKQQEL